MRIITIIGAVTGLSLVAGLVVAMINEMIIMHESIDDIDYKAIEDKIFEEHMNSKRK